MLFLRSKQFILSMLALMGYAMFLYSQWPLVAGAGVTGKLEATLHGLFFGSGVILALLHIWHKNDGCIKSVDIVGRSRSSGKNDLFDLMLNGLDSSAGGCDITLYLDSSRVPFRMETTYYGSNIGDYLYLYVSLVISNCLHYHYEFDVCVIVGKVLLRRIEYLRVSFVTWF